ncbi:hypothetical protein [Vibrio sp. WXL210]|uniref:hypothetical protein n=1 Tax=Vibrio sp. WXL210 TaxID=3450709 RepID=UPI003EC7AD9D
MSIDNSVITKLSEREISAVEALYELEKASGEAVYVLDEHVGVWLSDLDFECEKTIFNDLGLYTIEYQTLSNLIKNRIVYKERFCEQESNITSGYKLTSCARAMLAANRLNLWDGKAIARNFNV